MKAALPVLLVWILYACTSNEVKQYDETPVLSISEAYNQGKIENSEQYFYGVLSEIVEIDLLHREIEMLDEENGDLERITERLDSCDLRIDRATKSLDLYSDKEWSDQSTFQSLTYKWLNQMNVVLNKLRPLSDPFSRADSSWSENDYALYEAYSIALDSLTTVDNQWVAFQYDYATANAFKLDTASVIDVTELARKDLSNF